MNKEYMNELINAHNVDLFATMASVKYDVSYGEAQLDYYNYFYKKKWLITEARDGYDGRMFIRNITNIIEDTFKKEGWWNTFCYTRDLVSKGYWISEIIRYTFDKDGYINVIVKPIHPMPDLKRYRLFEKKDGTYESIGIEFMICESGRFHESYRTKPVTRTNIAALVERFPEYKGWNVHNIAEDLLIKYLKNEVELSTIEDALNDKFPYEKLCSNIGNAIINKTLDSEFGEWPLFCNKIKRYCISINSISSYEIKDFLENKCSTYYELVSNGKMPDENIGYFHLEYSDDPVKALDIAEKVIGYYEDLRAKEKADRKAKRKANKKSS